MNKKKRLVPSKTYLDVNEKKKQIARELAVIERNKVSLPELDKRVWNIPNIDRILREDADLKWRIKHVKK